MVIKFAQCQVPKVTNSLSPGDQVLRNTWSKVSSSDQLQPRWKGSHQVPLSTPTEVKFRASQPGYICQGSQFYLFSLHRCTQRTSLLTLVNASKISNTSSKGKRNSTASQNDDDHAGATAIGRDRWKFPSSWDGLIRWDKKRFPNPG